MELHPHLIVRDAPRALAFYVEALGAREVARYTEPSGFVVNAELAIGDLKLTLAEERREWHNVAPPSLDGSPVILTLQVDDARAVAARLERAGATVVFPVADQFYGERAGRLRDPFGHVWIVTQRIEALTPEEIQRRMDAG